MNDFLPTDKLEHAEEIGTYLAYSFGNEIRLDYGTGHESFLVIFLFCLNKLEIVHNSELKELILSCFVEYLKTVRKLQTVYMLEPAGSHGVWGLDDYQCLVFLWGAAQLKGDKDISPTSIHDDSKLSEFSNEYLYLDAIKFIKHIKHGAPFAETSPMLNDISFLDDWGKVFNGLIRLYVGEVLNKYPVAQHFLFGNIFKATWIISSEVDRQNANQIKADQSSFGMPTSRPVPGLGMGQTVFHKGMNPRGSSGAYPGLSVPPQAIIPESVEQGIISEMRTAAPWAASKHAV